MCVCVYLPETLLSLAISSSSTVNVYPPVIKHGNGTSPSIDEFIKTSIWPGEFQLYLMEGKLPISYHKPTINQWECQDPKMQLLYYI